MSYTAKYYKKSTLTNVRVWYKCLDASGQLVKDFPNQACFSDIWYGVIPKNTDKIIVYRLLKSIPYDKEIIRKYIGEINKFGFPCKVVLPKDIKDADNEFVEISLNIKLYKKKLHLLTTLTFIRTLFEQGICTLPDVYLQSIETNPEIDKFILFQEAHKNLGSSGGYANSGHMATFKGNCFHKENITTEKFLLNINTSPTKVLESSSCYVMGGLNSKWK